MSKKSIPNPHPCCGKVGQIIITMNSWYFNPVMFEIGPFKAHWYGLMYAIAFILGYLYFSYSGPGKKTGLNEKQKDLITLACILGIIIGGRIGYILFYNFGYYLANPLKIFAVWEGGMSFHGGLIGALIGLLLSVKKCRAPFWPVADIITSIAPLGLFFTRIGNFINGELYGRVASSFCLHFPTDPGNCRYPSQLLQSLLEGMVLFIIMQIIIRKTKTPGVPSGLFLILYGIFRTFAEFFREPDPQIGFLPGGITQGQLLSFFMVICGIILLIYLAKTGNGKKHLAKT